MAEVRGKALAGWREAFHRVEGAMGQGQPPSEMSVGGQGRGEPVPQPPDFVFGGKVQVVKSDSCSGRGGAFLGRAPVNKFGLRNREGETFGGRDAASAKIITCVLSFLCI